MSGQDWTLPAQLGQLKTEQGGKRAVISGAPTTFYISSVTINHHNTVVCSKRDIIQERYTAQTI